MNEYTQMIRNAADNVLTGFARYFLQEPQYCPHRTPEQSCPQGDVCSEKIFHVKVMGAIVADDAVEKLASPEGSDTVCRILFGSREGQDKGPFDQVTAEFPMVTIVVAEEAFDIRDRARRKRLMQDLFGTALEDLDVKLVGI